MKWNTIDKHQCKDSAFALILLLLIIYFTSNHVLLLKIVIVTSIIAMVFPELFRPFAFIWFQLSKLLGMFIPKIVLTLIFIVFVVPVGIFRRLIGKDDMKLNEWKKSHTSVFNTKNHLYTQEDFNNPF